MVGGTRIGFESIPWQAMAPGARHKAVTRAGKRIRLVEFTADFVEADWCTKGHVGYVLAGELEIVFDDRSERFGPADAFVILAGAERHKARANGPLVRLLLVEEV
jgi:quercetin dioxygenase-like cupin family protein